MEKSKDFKAFINLSYIPEMKAIVPPETPGITFAAPMATPFRKSAAAFFTKLK